MSRFKRLAPYFLIGPISGPLLAGVVHNLRGGRPVLGVMYAVALAEYAVLLPSLMTKMALTLG